MKKPKYNQKWFHWHHKLAIAEMLIDCAGIKHLSKKMFNTGKISNKVRKKWKAREQKSLYGKKYGKLFTKCEHRWFPQSVLGKPKHLIAGLYWSCCKCRSSTNIIWPDECLKSFMTEPYIQFVDLTGETDFLGITERD